MLSVPPVDGSTGSQRIEMTWIDISIGDIPISEDVGLLLGIKALQDNITSLDNNAITTE
jgi:hypothetical protein